MESCWGLGWGTGSYITTDSAALLSAQLTAPLPTGEISLVTLLIITLLFAESGAFHIQKVALMLSAMPAACFAKYTANIVPSLSQSCDAHLFFQPHPFSIQTSAPYSIRNLSESSLTQYELDSKCDISTLSRCCVFVSSVVLCLHKFCHLCDNLHSDSHSAVSTERTLHILMCIWL